ncbi:MAG: acyl carrier protein [Chloroflexota bacterium]|nr:acyl carrier protein [Chloroflexota bacterium]
METIIEQLTTIIADKLDANIKREEITPQVSLFEDGLCLDSIMLVELISLVEENFGFRFAEDELDLKTFAHLNTLAAFVATKTEHQTDRMTVE